MDRMLKAKKREGSVLLQTLVMCVILSFIAVSLTRWALGRYSAVNKTYTDTIYNSHFMRNNGNLYSRFASQMSSGYITFELEGTCGIYGGVGVDSDVKYADTGIFKHTTTCTLP